MPISANYIVNVKGSVLNAGFNAANLINNVLTENILVSASARTLPFNSLKAVGSYFGFSSDEYLYATKYFGSFNGSSQLPAQILFSRYVQSDTSAYLFGSAVGAGALALLQALSAPTFVANINGTAYPLTLTQSQLVACTGLTDVATLLQTGLAAALVGCTVAIINSNQFVVSSPAGIAASTISYCSGNVSDLINLSLAQAPVLSQGIVGGNAAANMAAIVNANPNWLSLSYVTRLTGDTQTAHYPVTVDLSSWIATQDNNYIGLWWEGIATGSAVASLTMWSDLVAAGYGVTTAGQTVFNLAIQVDYNGINTVNPVGNDPVGLYSAFVGGMGASINYAVRNGKINFAGKTQDGLAPNVSNDIDYQLLLARGYNVYGQFATRSNSYNLSETGSIGGQYFWIDNIYDANWLFDQIQNNLMLLIRNTNRIPYNAQGQSMVNAILTNVAQSGLNNGVIESGNTFSQAQIQAIIQLVGYDISPQLASAGYFVYFAPITADERASRSPMQVSFLYTNGGCVNSIDVGAVFIQ